MDESADGGEVAEGEEVVDDEEVVDEDGNVEDSEEVIDEDGEEESADDLTDDADGEAVDEANDDEDFTPIEDIMSDDEGESEESSEESSDDDADGETAEEAEIIDDEEEDEVGKTLVKMVKVLERLDKRITHLERENIGLKKQLSDVNKTVQTEPRNVAKSRPTPNTNLRLVKGSYNRPPVSTQYVANQRDIGIGKKAESSDDNTSVFRKELNEVFADCNRIANQTH